MLGSGEVQDLLARHGLQARRSLGQNFVVDPGTVTRIARLAGIGPDDRVVEIGPGLGSLTLALAATGARVLAVEKDRGLLPALEEVLDAESPGTPVRVIEGDALDLDWDDVLGADRWVLVANLPYNVAVPVVMTVLARAPQVHRLVVMVQSEVAERLCAEPGGRTIGIPSIKVAWYASTRIAARIGPEVFIPRPRVDSAVVVIERRDPPSRLVVAEQVFPLVEQAYRQRRKMLRSSLGRTVGPESFAAAGIDPELRPERLDLGDWARLAEVLAAADAGSGGEPR